MTAQADTGPVRALKWLRAWLARFDAMVDGLDVYGPGSRVSGRQPAGRDA